MTEHKITDARTETYLKELEESGTVKMKIHPEHFERITKLHGLAEEALKERRAKERISELAEKKHEVAREELWMAIHDSYDETMDILSQEAAGEGLELEKGLIVFRNKRSAIRTRGLKVMGDLGMPRDMMEGILKYIDKKLGEDVDDDIEDIHFGEI